jgi:transcription antitermination factor NusA-like protein
MKISKEYRIKIVPEINPRSINIIKTKESIVEAIENAFYSGFPRKDH